jgi:predicted nucleic acid-binding protein
VSARGRLVLDANILMRAVIGNRVVRLLDAYKAVTQFCAPEACFEEAREWLPPITRRRSGPRVGLAVLDKTALIVESMAHATYSEFEPLARELMARRDMDDWPIAAAALKLRSPIWTEDQDFFGCGIATWTTDRVKVYLEGRFDSA